MVGIAWSAGESMTPEQIRRIEALGIKESDVKELVALLNVTTDQAIEMFEAANNGDFPGHM